MQGQWESGANWSGMHHAFGQYWASIHPGHHAQWQLASGLLPAVLDIWLPTLMRRRGDQNIGVERWHYIRDAVEKSVCVVSLIIYNSLWRLPLPNCCWDRLLAFDKAQPIQQCRLAAAEWHLALDIVVFRPHLTKWWFCARALRQVHLYYVPSEKITPSHQCDRHRHSTTSWMRL